ncbi:anthrax toxin lethal factor-related metalloendopeptidase [Zavarzinella formosa]|uniref:anthrax toxin lethal factor-related metalloendopeptidase n=1 Tax=Zavarzinella formosa TaxID=360055 RepID=UPI00036530A1|nr:hypothetical protein [Zavarzinella formosa]
MRRHSSRRKPIPAGLVLEYDVTDLRQPEAAVFFTLDPRRAVFMILRVLALLCLIVSVAAGQTPKTPAPKTPASKGPKKKDESPEGYKKSDLRGFTLYFSDEVLEENEKTKLKRTPLEALERELIIVESVIPPDKLKSIKAVPIWVEWNESVAMGNGRGGTAVAVFSGGSQQDVFAEAKKGIKGKSVTILKLRSLALEHQPVTDSGRCVTLHELAHAFQHFVVGDDNIIVRNTYKQAMERKLYDPALYVATNEHEYFAELTCAYLDRMDAYPRTREELKKHDPKAHEMMEKFWGRVPEKKDPVAKGPKLPSKDGDGKFPLDLKVSNLKFGPAITGELPEARSRAGRPMLVVLWSPNNDRMPQLMQKLNPLFAELRDFGLLVIGGHQSDTPEEEIKFIATSRNIEYPLCPDARIGPTEGFRLPHAIVYDQAGKCVFRGDPLDGEIYARLIVNQEILAKTGKETWAKGVKPVVDLLEQGAGIPAALTKLNAIGDSLGSEAKPDWTALRDALTEGAKKQVDEAETMMKDDPVAAWLILERVAAAYKYTPPAKTAGDMILKLRSNPKVALEVRARTALEPIKKLDVQLSGKELSFDPRQPEFRSSNSATLKQLGEAVEKMKKTFPDARATVEAVRMADHWRVSKK